ncbi:MAG: hypothetical protein A2V98_24965 [Planctomycetes bacterium RBG_16_64_12]|nr:MAG: hypothetical protein A2V98_24965 [Planctomycetes bacterium RBG_16_64_12]
MTDTSTRARAVPLSLAEAIELILEDRREEGMRRVPEDAIKEVVSLGSNGRLALLAQDTPNYQNE